MKRRQFIVGLGSTVAWPVVAGAQQPEGMPVIGFLHSQSPNLYTSVLPAFRQGLKEAGYVEGQNVVVEYRYAENQLASLCSRSPKLILSST